MVHVCGQLVQIQVVLAVLVPVVILVAANRLAVTVDCLLSDSPAPKGDTWYLILRQLLNGRTKKDEGGDTAPPSVSG